VRPAAAEHASAFFSSGFLTQLRAPPVFFSETRSWSFLRYLSVVTAYMFSFFTAVEVGFSRVGAANSKLFIPPSVFFSPAWEGLFFPPRYQLVLAKMPKRGLFLFLLYYCFSLHTCALAGGHFFFSLGAFSDA